MTPRGRFVTLEGVEGGGKSTLLRNLLGWAEDRGIPCVVTREPGGTPFGAELRRILLDPEGPRRAPEAELLLYLADRFQDVTEKVLPAVESGAWAICDRYHDATVAYQGHARGLDLGMIRELARALRLPVPDLTILVDVDPAISLPRAIRRNRTVEGGEKESRFEAESLAFHRRVRAGYLDIAAREPERFFTVDGALPPEQVFRAAAGRLASLLGAPGGCP
ncbi:MAG: dTMP kinase [Acidobacteria bacterium]|nr:dTMP kinase [Acidobacteriota bacterium]